MFGWVIFAGVIGLIVFVFFNIGKDIVRSKRLTDKVFDLVDEEFARQKAAQNYRCPHCGVKKKPEGACPGCGASA